MVSTEAAENSRDQAVAERDKLYTAQAAAEKIVAGLKDDIAQLSRFQAETGARVANLTADYDAARARFDKELEQYRSNETGRVRREITVAEEAAQPKIAALAATVKQLEERKEQTEAALQALKARL